MRISPLLFTIEAQKLCRYSSLKAFCGRRRAVEHDDEYVRVVDRVDDTGRIVAHHVARRVSTAYAVRLEHRANVFDDGAHTVFVTQKYIGFFHIFTANLL